MAAMSTPQHPTSDDWAWPAEGDPAWAWPAEGNPAAPGDLAQHLEAAARAIREGRAVVRRSATSWTSTGPNHLDVDLSWSDS